MARAALPIFSPSCGRTRTMIGFLAAAPFIGCRFLHGACEFFKVPGFAEIAIDRGEPNICDAVQSAQSIHNHLADTFGWNFWFAGSFDLPLDAADELVDPLLWNIALAAGQRNRLF